MSDTQKIEIDDAVVTAVAEKAAASMKPVSADEVAEKVAIAEDDSFENEF
mgnify:CR=1 FL=1